MVDSNGKSLNFDFTGLEDKWSLYSHENCCECGRNFEENNEVPMRFWKGEGEDCMELALCWECGHKRLK